MKILILYKPVSELASSVEAYSREFTRQTSKQIELIDIESVRGVTLANLYDILQQPVIVAVQDNGALVDMWLERDSWPTINELSAYNT